MIALLYDVPTDTVKLTGQASLVFGADVPVTVSFSADPGGVSYLDVSLGSPLPTPGTLAFSDAFAQETATDWTALLDCSDTRLGSYLSGTATTVNLQVVAIIDGAKRITPNLALTVQPANYSGTPGSMGGPVYLTQTQSDARYLQPGEAGPPLPFLNGVPPSGVVSVPSGYGLLLLSGFTVPAGATLKIAAGGTLKVL